MQVFDLKYCRLNMREGRVEKNRTEVGFNDSSFFVLSDVADKLDKLIKEVIYNSRGILLDGDSDFVAMESRSMLGCRLTLGELKFLRYLSKLGKPLRALNLYVGRDIRCLYCKDEDLVFIISNDSFSILKLKDVVLFLNNLFNQGMSHYELNIQDSSDYYDIILLDDEVIKLAYMLSIVSGVQIEGLDTLLKSSQNKLLISTSCYCNSHFRLLETLHYWGISYSGLVNSLYECFGTGMSIDQLEVELNKFLYSEEYGNYELIALFLGEFYNMNLDINSFNASKHGLLAYAELSSSKCKSRVIELLNNRSRRLVEELSYLTLGGIYVQD